MREIAELGLKHRIPLMFVAHGEAVALEGLAAYGPDASELYRRSALYVDKIVKGARPAELPVEQPDIQKLRINLKTAKAIGIAIPRAIVVRADEVTQ